MNILPKEVSLTVEELEKLKGKIELRFKNRQLYKGVAEVIKAVDERRPMQELYVVGQLDPWYANALDACLSQTKMDEKLKIFKLPGNLRRLVYDAIKNVSFNEEIRARPRRFFLCRAFAI